MTPEQIEQERAAFEAWHKETFGYLPKKYKDGTFMSSSRVDEVNPQDMFEGWLARAEQDGWISVEEDLPDNDITVLTVTEEGFVYTNYLVEARGSAWDCIWKFDFTSSPITHWQPLPQPPKGGST